MRISSRVAPNNGFQQTAASRLQLKPRTLDRSTTGVISGTRVEMEAADITELVHNAYGFYERNWRPLSSRALGSHLYS